MSWFRKIQRFFHIKPVPVSTAEKLVSTLGGFIGIFLIATISYQFTGAAGAALIVPSMGASAVLLFAVPHGLLSQPWALFGGHLVSAIIGVSCYQLIPDTFLAAGFAVGLAIGAMHLLGCIHPPGGATALAAVIGGPAIHALNYEYVLAPILLNTVVIFFTAVVFNNFFAWRRYPISMMRFNDAPAAGQYQPSINIDTQNIERALADMDLVVDLSSEELQRLFVLSVQHAERQQLTSAQIQLGHYYTNGRHGAEWSVRQIIDEAWHSEPNKDMVIFCVVEGQGLRSADSCSRSEFAQWAAREVFPTPKI